MAFALQKRCSTTELSRRDRVTLPPTQRPKHQLGAAMATGLPQKSRHVAFHGASAQGERAGDGVIAESLQHKGEHASLRSADGDRPW